MQNNPKLTSITLNGVIGLSLIAASLAALMGAVWVLQYLLSTQFGGRFYGTALMDFVRGEAFDLEGKGSDALFVVVTRFVLATACLWLPITAALLFLRTLFVSGPTFQLKAEANAPADPTSIFQSDR